MEGKAAGREFQSGVGGDASVEERAVQPGLLDVYLKQAFMEAGQGGG